jgi:hypothetical protein
MNGHLEKSVVPFQSVTDFDEQLLKLTLERLVAVSATVLTRLQHRPIPMTLPERKPAPSEHARSGIEALQWEIYREIDFLGAIAQATKRAPRGRKKARMVDLKGGTK